MINAGFRKMVKMNSHVNYNVTVTTGTMADQDARMCFMCHNATVFPPFDGKGITFFGIYGDGCSQCVLCADCSDRDEAKQIKRCEHCRDCGNINGSAECMGSPTCNQDNNREPEDYRVFVNDYYPDTEDESPPVTPY